jgi:hypothetical protein
MSRDETQQPLTSGYVEPQDFPIFALRSNCPLVEAVAITFSD